MPSLSGSIRLGNADVVRVSPLLIAIHRLLGDPLSVRAPKSASSKLTPLNPAREVFRMNAVAGPGRTPLGRRPSQQCLPHAQANTSLAESGCSATDNRRPEKALSAHDYTSPAHGFV